MFIQCQVCLCVEEGEIESVRVCVYLSSEAIFHVNCVNKTVYKTDHIIYVSDLFLLESLKLGAHWMEIHLKGEAFRIFEYSHTVTGILSTEYFYM